MEFLGVGYQELLLILVLMLVVVGPERLPAMAYQIGRAVRTLQSYARAVRDEFSGEIEYLEEQYKTVKGEVDSARVSLRDQQREFEAEMRQSTAVDLPPLLPEASSSSSAKNGATNGAAPSANGTNGATPAAAPAEPAAPEAETSPPAPPLVF